MCDVPVKHGLENTILDLALDYGVLQTGDTQPLLGHVDQGFDRVHDRGGRRRDIDILAVSTKGPSLKLAACRKAVMQGSMFGEIFGSAGGAPAGEIIGGGDKLQLKFP